MVKHRTDGLSHKTNEQIVIKIVINRRGELMINFQ
jgi:hypothetical protein